MKRSVRHVERQLLVPLTHEEREKEIKNLTDSAKAKHEVESKVSALQESIKLHKANLELLNDQIDSSAEKIRDGVLKKVPCKMCLDWEASNILVFRKDTMEVVEDRAMNEHDKPELSDEIEEPETAKAKGK